MTVKNQTAPITPLLANEVPQWDIESDVLIVGFGGAGAAAAISARKAGAEVCIFEVASASGGTTALSSSEIYLGGSGGTPAQIKNGFNDSSEDMFNYLMMASGPNADEAKVRLYAENSRAHYDWLCEMGVPFNDTFVSEKTIVLMSDEGLLYTGSEEAYPFNTVAKPCPRGHLPKIKGDNGGPLLMKKLTEAVEQGGVRVEYNARALRLIADENGVICGVVTRIDMQERFARARRGVILCGGGFAMNHEMVRKHAPKLLRNGKDWAIGNPHDDGSVIRMGIGAGANAINMSEGFVSLPFYPPATYVKGILVNAQGQRFINEDCYHGRIGSFCLQQRDNAIYLIVDNELYDKPNSYINMEIAGTGETLEELEGEIGMPKGALESTIKVFNRFAEQGEDPLFNKGPKYLKPLNKPPYAAFDCSIGKVYYPYFTLGGLDTLPSGEALNWAGEIVPGLFAAGRSSCGLPRSAQGYSSGMSVGDATFFGRMAGASCAERQPT